MSFAYVVQHTPGVASTTGTTVVPTINSKATNVSGNYLGIWVSFDNLTTTTPTVSTIAVPAGETNTWQRAAFFDSPLSAAAAGVRGEFWWIKTTMAWPSSTAVTVTLSASVAAKQAMLFEFSATSAMGIAVRGTGSGNAVTGTSASAVYNHPEIGDLVFGASGAEQNNATVYTADSDVTGGSWSTVGTNQVGSTAGAGVVGIVQYKIPTTAAQQTYNPAVSADNGAVIVCFYEITTTPVSKDIQELWNINSAITKAAQYLANVRTSLSQARQMLWNTPPPGVLFTAELWENGVFKASLGSKAMYLSSTGELDFYWDASQLTNATGDDVEIRLYSSSTADIGALAWDTQVTVIPVTPISRDLSYLWSARMLMFDTTQGLWGILSRVTQSRQELWNDSATLTKASQELWNLQAALSKADQMLWSARALLTDSTEYPWNDRVALTKADSFQWNDAAAISLARQELWNVLASVAKSPQELWGTLARVTQSRQEIWNDNVAVTKASQELWNDSAAISQVRQALWKIAQAISQSRQELWLTKAPVSQSRQELWTTRQVMTDATQFVWTDNLSVSDQISVLWNLGSIAAVLARAFIWNDLTALSKSSQELWNDRAVISKVDQLLWKDNMIVTDQTTINWNLRAVVQALAKSVMWNDLSSVSATTQELWAIREGLEKSIQEKWNNLVLISEDTTVNWASGGTIAVLTDIVWDLIAHRMVNVWLDGAWRQAVLRIWNGTEWNEPDIKIWNGSEWV